MKIERLSVTSILLQECLQRMKGLAPVYSCSEKCGVKGQKTVVDNTDKLEEAGMPYVWRITLIPLVHPVVRA